MKSKKIISICLLMILFMSQFSFININNYVYASDNPISEFKTSMTLADELTNINQLYPGDEFEVNVDISSFKNIEKGLIVLGGQLQYENNILELVSINENKNIWNKMTMNEKNLKFIIDSDDYVLESTENKTVFTIKFKVKETIDNTISSRIRLYGMEASNSIIDIPSNDIELGLTINERPDAITSNDYLIEEGIISRIPANTTVSEFKKYVDTYQNMIFTDKNGNILKDDSLITTGTKLQVGKTLSFTLIVTGDTDGNGIINPTDVGQLVLHYIGKKTLDGIYFKAADVDRNSAITLTDIAKIKLAYTKQMPIK